MSHEQKRAEFLSHLKEACSMLRPGREAEEIPEILEKLYHCIFNEHDLLNPVGDGATSHHPMVLKHMIEIAHAERFTFEEMKISCALALLHDVYSVPKITKLMIRSVADKNKAMALEQKARQYRSLHMRGGSARAHEVLLEMNSDKILFDDREIECICNIIAIHDNPSIDKKISKDNWIAVCFREADRLWMLTQEGIRTDLVRSEKDPDLAENKTLQARNNIMRFCEERQLYYPEDGPFMDYETFFRTKAGFELYLHYCEMWEV